MQKCHSGNNAKFRRPRISCNMKYLLDTYFQTNKKYSHLITCYPICLETRTFIVRGFHGKCCQNNCAEMKQYKLFQILSTLGEFLCSILHLDKRN